MSQVESKVHTSADFSNFPAMLTMQKEFLHTVNAKGISSHCRKYEPGLASPMQSAAKLVLDFVSKLNTARSSRPLRLHDSNEGNLNVRILQLAKATASFTSKGQFRENKPFARDLRRSPR